MFYLNVEAVNTHRDRPLVSRLKVTRTFRYRRKYKRNNLKSVTMQVFFFFFARVFLFIP